MNNVIYKDLKVGYKFVGKILMYIGDSDPVKYLDEAISEYTNIGENYREFIDANMDNPWVRIIILKEVL